MPNKPPPEPWQSFLLELDGLVMQEVHLHCLGGFAVTQVYGLSRKTADIDVLSAVIPNEARHRLGAGSRSGALHAKHGVYLDFVHLSAQPEDYESRLTEVFCGAYTNLRIFALDPYDLALTKLERNIERDREDVRFLARTVPFDLGILRERYEKEMRIYLGQPEREDLTLQLWIEVIEEERRK